MDTMSTAIPAPRVVRSSAHLSRTSRAWYWVAAAIFVFGVLVPVVWGLTSVRAANEKARAFPRAAVPGAGTVTVTDPGDQMIYFMGPGDRSPAALGLRVTDPAGGAVPVAPYDLAVKLDLVGAVGTAVATFPADVQGVYTVTSTGSGVSDGALAVGADVAGDALPGILGALVVMVFCVDVAIVIVIVTLVRGASRRRAAFGYPSPGA
jgi:hypothetical protein